MTELQMTKAIVKLPRKNSSANRHSQLVDVNSNHETLVVDDFLVTDKLYIDGSPSSVIETEIRDLVLSYKPIRIHLNRDHDFASGYIQFTTKEMADRAYTLLKSTLPHGIELKINSPSGDYPEPEAHAGILQIENLPCNTNNKLLYDLFRPFGPMILCNIKLEQDLTFKGIALVQYFHSENAQHAQDVMNNKTVQDNVISVFPFVSRVKSFISTTSNSTTAEPNKTAIPSSNRNSISIPASPPAPAPIMTSSTPQIRSDGSSMVDYTNLYIKNLDPDVKSADLFSNFRKFGRIISARVMKNAQTNQSKGFGFVSFSKADEAQKAKQEMNNQYILSKAVIVAFHEPKKVRDIEVSPPNSTFNASYQQQQQQQIAASVSPVLVQHQQSTYTRPSPTQPTAVNSPQSNLFEQQKYPQQQQQQMQIYHYQQQQSTNGYSNGHSMKNNHQDVPDQRYNTRNTMPVSQKYNNSNSYQQPDLHQPSPTPTNGQTSNYYQPMARNNSSSSGYHHHTNNGLGIYEQQRQQQQQNQQIHQPRKTYEPTYQHSQPLKRNLSAAGSTQNPTSLSSLAGRAYMNTPAITATNTPSSATAVSINNGYPHHHPQQQYAVSPPVQSQVSNHQSYQYRHQQQQQPQDRPTLRRRGSVESVTSVMTETSSETRRHTITKAVLAIEKSDIEDLHDIVDMLLTLKKKDLATCLFNKVFLKSKIKQAKDALNIFQEQQQDDHEDNNNRTVIYDNNIKTLTTYRVSPPSPPSVNYYYKTETMPKYIQDVSLPPKGSRAIPIVAPPPAPVSTPIPAAVDSPTSTLNDKELSDEIDKFLEAMKGLELHQQKQMLGNRLFPLVKSTGVKHAPKITIRLLDSIPLDELAYSMYDKDKLKNQVSQVASTISARY